MIRWDEIFYIFIACAMVLSPALLALVWAWLTRIPKVRMILVRAFIAVLTVPFLSTGLYAMFTRLCGEGHLDQQFGDCGIAPDFLAEWAPIAPFILVIVAAAAAIYCVYLEVHRFSQRVTNA